MPVVCVCLWGILVREYTDVCQRPEIERLKVLQGTPETIQRQDMDTTNSHNGGIMWFFRDKGFDDSSIQDMLRKCKRLEGLPREKASENWAYLESIGIQERKLPSVVGKCPKILALGLHEKLVPMVECLSTLGTKPNEVASAITKFPNVLSHSVEEKLCPLLAFFESLGLAEKQIGKMILVNPRIISYSIETKLTELVNFLGDLGLSKEGTIGKVLAKHPYIMGFSVEKRLRPTKEFLTSLGLSETDLQRVIMHFPEVMSRDVDKILRRNVEYLRSCGFVQGQIAALVAGYPPVLIKSTANSLAPRIKFLTDVMERGIHEIAEYPDFFRHGLKKRLEPRHKVLKRNNINGSLSEMLDCNHKKFLSKFCLVEQLA